MIRDCGIAVCGRVKPHLMAARGLAIKYETEPLETFDYLAISKSCQPAHVSCLPQVAGQNFSLPAVILEFFYAHSVLPAVCAQHPVRFPSFQQRFCPAPPTPGRHRKWQGKNPRAVFRCGC